MSRALIIAFGPSHAALAMLAARGLLHPAGASPEAVAHTIRRTAPQATSLLRPLKLKGLAAVRHHQGRAFWTITAHGVRELDRIETPGRSRAA